LCAIILLAAPHLIDVLGQDSAEKYEEDPNPHPDIQIVGSKRASGPVLPGELANNPVRGGVKHIFLVLTQLSRGLHSAKLPQCAMSISRIQLLIHVCDLPSVAQIVTLRST